MKSTKAIIDITEKYGARNYHPLDVVLAKGEGCWVWDPEGNRYMDMLSAYSALNQGHRHPKIVQALKDQADKITITSRAFHNELLGDLYKAVAALAGMDSVLAMRSGAEAVETAVKAARKWGYNVKGIADEQAEIVVCLGNYHGRTTTCSSFSSEEDYRKGFGPFTPGFKQVPYGDSDALEKAITPNTCAFLVEPIQGEAGVVLPPEGYLTRCREICTRHNVLFIVDEVQTGFGRTGKNFCVEHENVTPDAIIMGKALSGGFLPVSAVASREEVLGVFNPGEHGSTFGGSPLACAVALAAIDVVVSEDLAKRSAELGEYFIGKLKEIKSGTFKEVSVSVLFVGIELDTPARPFCEELLKHGMLCKETHDYVIRFAPALTISKEDLDWSIERIKKVLEP